MIAEKAMGPTPRTLIVHLEDHPGALNRVVSVFRRRACNIESLVVGRSEQPGVSRITLVVAGADGAASRMALNLYKLVDVLHVEDVTSAAAVIREMVFVKLEARMRTEVLQLCQIFRARVVDVGPASITVEATGTQDKMDGLIEVLRPFGILELARTGAVAMVRGLPSAPIGASEPFPHGEPSSYDERSSHDEV